MVHVLCTPRSVWREQVADYGFTPDGHALWFVPALTLKPRAADPARPGESWALDIPLDTLRSPAFTRAGSPPEALGSDWTVDPALKWAVRGDADGLLVAPLAVASPLGPLGPNLGLEPDRWAHAVVHDPLDGPARVRAEGSAHDLAAALRSWGHDVPGVVYWDRVEGAAFKRNEVGNQREGRVAKGAWGVSRGECGLC